DPNTKIGQEQRLVGKSFMALNGIDLTVYKGEALGIIGGNGAGKSTMLKLLSRVTAPTEGEIDIYGRIASMLEVGTGFNGELTGRENVYMNGAILGMTKAEIDAKMEDIIEFSEVRDFIDTPVKRYSSGMYVKLAFSVAAHLDSEIMIMDEVLAVGDMAFQKKCLDKMRDAAKKEGRTVLYVSHNMNTIRQLCDRCVVLDKGRVIFEGDVEEGIRMYFGNASSSDKIIDLSKIKREPQFASSPVKMSRFEACNSDSAVFDVGEYLTFDLHYNSIKDINDAYIRMMIKTTDGMPVTMMTTNQGIAIKKDLYDSVKITADISRLVPGKYMLSLVIYEVDQFGTNINHDVLRDFYAFEVITKTGFNNNMPWLSRYWGNTYCDPLVIVK
ncbi:MAG: ABC transporter ATP-binding protein, partial [Clostridia bacterium]|nr:ABC transporter ATP-binding protein [Clostridia bacterium]